MSELSPDSERKRMLANSHDILKSLYEKDKPKDNNPFNALIGTILKLNNEVRDYIKPIVDAGGLRDKPAMEDQLLKLYLFGFSKFSKDELEAVAAWMLTATAMQGLYPDQLGRDPQLPGESLK